MKNTLKIIILLFIFSTTHAQTRYVCQGILNLETKINNGIPVMDKLAKEGINGVILTVMWERVHPTYGSKPDFAQLDNQINHAVNDLGLKVAIRIHLGRNINSINGFWGEDESVKDSRGKVLTDYYNNNHFSFAFQPAIDKAVQFVNEVADRYKGYNQKGQILYISVVNTPQQELGYAYQNQQWPDPIYAAIFDHSVWGLIKWRAWCKEKYTTITTLNSYWGTNYTSFEEVQPFSNRYDVFASFRGYRGKDWYLYRHYNLKNYYNQLIRSIKSVDNTYKVACEYGGVVDNLAPLRGTVAFKDLSANADIVKTFVFDMQPDIVSSNLSNNQKFYTEIAHFDLPTPQELTDYTKRAMSYGCELIGLYLEYDDNTAYNKILPAVREAVAWKNKPIEPIIYADTATYRLSQMIDNRAAILEHWQGISNNGQKKIKVTYDEDIIRDNKKIENPLPDVVVNNPTPTSPPPPPPVIDPTVPNIPPRENVSDFLFTGVINQYVNFHLPNNLYSDPDGFIALIDVIEIPSWLSFNQYEMNFYGTPRTFGKYKIRLKVYDNRGAAIESALYVEVGPPSIDFELIKGDYFDIPIEPYGYITNNRVLYLESLPEKLNIVAHANLDSTKFQFELNGPYKYERLSDRTPHNLFGEGRGLKFPLGVYTLTAKAIKKDSLFTSKTITFTVKNSTNKDDKLDDWVVYPNPFDKVCNLKLPDSEDFSQLSFSIYSNDGRKQDVEKKCIKLVDKTVYIDFSSIQLFEGSYILEIKKQGEMLKRIRIGKY